MEIKTKVNKRNLIKLKSFCTAKETISKVEKKPLRMGENNSKWSNWQRINFQNIQAAHTTQYQKNNPIKKWGKDLNRRFSKEDIQMANKHMKRCSTSVIIREMQIKLQWDITSHQSEWPSSKSLQTINSGKDVEKREHSCTVGGNVNWYIHYGRQYGDSLKKKQTRNKTTIWPSNSTPQHIPWGNQNWKRHIYPIVHCSTIYYS